MIFVYTMVRKASRIFVLNNGYFMFFKFLVDTSSGLANIESLFNFHCELNRSIKRILKL
ncbi:hypothetical protein HHI36_003902 [Cryptolaemus montrouzieri]|uniref:Uncharacterized protein n=1 Tax=Cryptolaemus montrouzieri TaxID=559131 RepID=A0ABD2NPU3_9CUCU